MPRVASLLAALASVLVTGAAWWQSRSWWKTVLVALLCSLLGFGKKVWVELEPIWVKRAASALDRYVVFVFGGYRGRYGTYTYYRHRTFDVKGFSTQGKFALELETVYVHLNVDPAVPGSIAQDPIRPPSETTNKGPRDILGWLQFASEGPQNFAVVGPPGSGKTTLLKHLALALIAGNSTLKLTPVLLFLRDHCVAIGANPDLKLADLIDTSLTEVPPPAGWFADRLKRGKCLVMFDGLDEVADPGLRRKVVQWAERQVDGLGANRFLVSSRPNGYRDNPLAGFTVLRVLPFSREQVTQFVQNWYLANELMAYQKDDPGVHMEARGGAAGLLSRLRESPTLQELAVNPLLLTLIATVHRYRSELPGRRVELFAEICDVFLGKRQTARGLELDLTPSQKVRVLRVLAYEMMRREVREIVAAEAAAIIADALRLVAPASEPLVFLQTVENSSALLLQREGGVYGFAHLTFQEYLASVHIKEERLVLELTARVERTWWHETARLYAAQADATPIVEKCITAPRPSVEALMLATDCEAEALELRSELRERLSRITEAAIEDPEQDRRRLARRHMLARRSRNMLRINDDLYLDSSPINHAEYQLFIDEMRSRGECRQPDHWDTYQHPPKAGYLPVTGIREEDARQFCRWLTETTVADWRYSLPDKKELADVSRTNASWASLRFYANGLTPGVELLTDREIFEQIRSDVLLVTTSPPVNALTARASRRILWLASCSNPERLTNTEAARASAREIDRDLDFQVGRDLVMRMGWDPASVELSRTLEKCYNRHPDHCKGLYMLNWLCLAEKRARGFSHASEALWLSRARSEKNTTSE
jgi:energy-coupling factor transporter ATP-binding protein EcfA2